MTRKEALGNISSFFISFFMGNRAAPLLSESSAFIENFQFRWANTHEYCLKVIQIMPESGFRYRPTEKIMSFGEQMNHIGYWNTFLFGIFTKEDPMAEPPVVSKQSVLDFCNHTFHYTHQVLKNLDPAQINKKGIKEGEYWQNYTGRDVLLKAFLHTAHHRGQCIVYLRENGIQPPGFDF